MATDPITSSSLVANPVDAYLLVKRLTIDWDVVERVLNVESNSSRSKCISIWIFMAMKVLQSEQSIEEVIEVYENHKANDSVTRRDICLSKPHVLDVDTVCRSSRCQVLNRPHPKLLLLNLHPALGYRIVIIQKRYNSLGSHFSVKMGW